MNKQINDELIDIVNESDRVVKTMMRSEAEAQKVQFRRCVLVFLRNQKNQLAILRRAANKTYHPGYMSIVAGGVQSGESYYEAFIRETEEEAQISPILLPHRKLGIITPRDWESPMFKMVYEVKVATDNIPFNTDDFSELRWLTAEHIQHIQHSDTTAPDILWLVQRFYPEFFTK